jgi:5-methylcytosine-specific restriction endonuclease McrA
VRHFVAYHNAEKMGHEYEPSGEYSFFSRKALTFLEQTVGATVWVINGSRPGTKKTTYTLCAVYMPDEVVDAEDVEFDYIVAGTVGRDFDPPIEMNPMPWFPSFLKSQSNFSLGINEIKDAVVIEQLTSLAKGIDLSSLLASCEYSLPSDIDSLDIEVTEGRAKYVAHLRRERNRAVIEVKKTEALAKYDRLCCEICSFDFGAFYGEMGEGFCEVHHKIPLALLDGKRVTTLADLAIACSNCHRILHRHKPMPSIIELRERIDRAKT